MCSAVPFRGSIIGTRRSGSVPMSKTRESQLAVTTASGQRARHLPRNQARVPRRRLGHRHGHLGRRRPACAARGGGTRSCSGRRSWYCRPVRPGAGRSSRSRGGPGRPRAARAWPPSPACRPASTGRPRAPRRTASQRSRTSAPTVPSSPSAASPTPRRTCGPPRRAPTASRARWPCEPSVSASGRATGRGRPRPGAAPAPGRPAPGRGSARPRPRPWPARWPSCPTFRKVATSDRLASPTMTCRRRKRLGSACGSSRVLTIGPLERRLEPDDLLEELGPLGDLELDRRRRPAPASPRPPCPTR